MPNNDFAPDSVKPAHSRHKRTPVNVIDDKSSGSGYLVNRMIAFLYPRPVHSSSLPSAPSSFSADQAESGERLDHDSPFPTETDCTQKTNHPCCKFLALRILPRNLQWQDQPVSFKWSLYFLDEAKITIFLGYRKPAIGVWPMTWFKNAGRNSFFQKLNELVIMRSRYWNWLELPQKMLNGKNHHWRHYH
ncbi:MAG: hypothetical protein BJ554DRAFT_3767 [Olpidium bornovanus]|uniref:Uncharacterized protein n=1 Tax=Olpidium bornovanus TaxID=278681 RepID=A0A8H8A0L6_9FUNG|nr:MAG: hypothetical protein BJ554DRAFT_3767 [Olpidium bornovanus]